MAERFPLAIVLSAVDRLSGPLKKVEGSLKRFGKTATDAGKKMTMGLTVPTVALGAGILKVAGDFEAANLLMQALTGKTAAGIAGVTNEAKRLGSETQFSAAQVMDGMVLLRKGGLELGDIIGSTESLLQFAAAAEMDFATAAKTAIGAVKGQSMEIEQLSTVTDALINGSLAANVSVGELAQGLAVGGGIAKDYGMSLKETIAVLAALNEREARGAQAGTILRNTLNLLVRQVGAASQAFEDMELTTADFFSLDGEEKFLGMANALTVLENAMPSDLLRIFGTEGGPGFSKLLTLGAEGLGEMEGKLDATGKTAAIARTLMGGLNGSLKGFWSAVEGAAIAIGDSGMLQWFTEMVTKGTAMIRMIRTINPAFLKWAAVAIGVVAAIGPLLLIVGQISLGIGGLAQAVAFLGPILATMAGVFTGTVIPAIWAFTTAILANPIGLIVAGVVALIAGLVLLGKKNETVRKALAAAWDFLKDAWFVFQKLVMAGVRSLIYLFQKLGTMLGFEGPEGSLMDAIADRGSIPEGELATAATAPAAAPSAAGANGRVSIDFSNLPPGTRVNQDDLEGDVELGLGFSLGATV